jgi:hypothetical protein
MADLKLPRLPERTPVKLTVALAPDLAAALEDYRAIYNERYKADEPLSELVPHMLAAFLAGDREFARARATMKQSG